MKSEEISRRSFLILSAAGVSYGWLTARLPDILAAQEHAHRAGVSNAPAKFEFFTPEQAAEVEAIAAQIIPSDDTPGAREAHVIYFIDRALATFEKNTQATYLKGIREIQSRVKKSYPKASRFSDLQPEQQMKLLKAIEKTVFFETVRTHTVVGFLANPEYGGNYERAGWKVIGFDDSFVFRPPFGYYDRETSK